MIKKTLVGGSLALLLAGLLAGTGALGYLKTSYGYAKDGVSGMVPVSMKIDTARRMVKELDQPIKDNMTLIASEKVAVAKLRKQVEAKEELLSSSEHDIMRMTADLKSGMTRFVYSKKTYTADQVKTDLAGKFKRFKTHEATLDKLQQMLSAREASLQAAKDRMDEMCSAKRQLEVEIENLQAQHAANQVAQTASTLSLDDSQLSRARDMMDQIRTQIEVEGEVLAVDNEYHGGIQVDDADNNTDILDQVTNYFDNDTAPEVDSVAMIEIE